MSEGVQPTADVAVVLSTAPSGEEGARLARALLEERLAACVNVVAGVRSLYRWEGAIQDDNEVLLVIKTARARADEAVARLKELHSYTCPEALVLAPTAGAPDYLRWLLEVTA